MTHNILAAGGEPNPLVPHLSEIILVLIIFGILYYLVWKYVVPRFEANFAARKDAIEGGIARAEAAQAEAAQIRKNGRAEAQRIVEELRAQAQQESDRIVARGEEQLQTQRGQVVRELRQEIGTLAVELSEKIVGEQLADDARVSATVDSFIADLERQDAAEQAR